MMSNQSALFMSSPPCIPCTRTRLQSHSCSDAAAALQVKALNASLADANGALEYEAEQRKLMEV